MIIANMSWTKESVRDFTLFYSLNKSKSQKVMLISYFICMAVLLIIGLVTFIITKVTYVLIVIFVALAIMLLYGVFLYMLMRSMAKKLLEANGENDGLELYIAEEGIMISKEAKPIGMIEWDKLEEGSLTPTATYITTKENSLLIVEDKDIKFGDKAGLIKLLKEKNVKLIGKEL